MKLEAYFERIGYRGTPRVDFATLRDLHRLHLLTIAYENLDVQLKRPVGIDIEPIYHKIVEEHRGGWCYEMNGLLAWALETIGFSLTRMTAGVHRVDHGDAAVGNHLALWVHLDTSYLADVGFGDGMLEPIAIEPGKFRQGIFDFELERLPDGWWRFHNHEHGSAPSFDFHLSPGERARFEAQCQFLQTSPQSPFTQVAVVQRHLPQGLALLRGRLLKVIHADRTEKRTIEDRADYATTLRDLFGLEPPELGALWDNVQRQHAEFMAANANEQAAGG